MLKLTSITLVAIVLIVFDAIAVFYLADHALTNGMDLAWWFIAAVTIAANISIIIDCGEAYAEGKQ